MVNVVNAPQYRLQTPDDTVDQNGQVEMVAFKVVPPATTGGQKWYVNCWPH